MELETLKAIWQDQQLPRDGETSREDLLALLQKKSGSPIARMRRNLRKEAILLVISYIPIIIFYWIAFGGRLSGISWVMFGFLVLFSGYYFFKNRLLKQMLCVSCEVRSNLSRQLTTLRKYIRFYFWTSTLIIPVTPVVAFTLVMYSRPANDPPYHWLRGISLLFLLILVLTVGMYFFNRWYINRLYGRHIGKLQQLLREMDEV